MFLLGPPNTVPGNKWVDLLLRDSHFCDVGERGLGRWLGHVLPKSPTYLLAGDSKESGEDHEAWVPPNFTSNNSLSNRFVHADTLLVQMKSFLLSVASATSTQEPLFGIA